MCKVHFGDKAAVVVLAASLSGCVPGPRGQLDNPESTGVSTTTSTSTLGNSGTEANVSVPGLQPPWRLTRKTDEATIFIDLSASMQGFVRDKGGPLFAVMSLLKDFLTKEGISDLYGSGFGTTITDPQPLPGPIELLSLPANQTNTCLAKPLEYAASSGDVSQRALIVISDGVASAAAGACGPTCTAGSDVACVAKALTELAKKRLGMWVVGFRMPFDGYYYPELGAPPYSAPQGTARPIYLWIFAPNVEFGRSLTSSLTTWGAANVAQGDTLAAEVWPGRWLGYRIADQPATGWSSSDFAAFDYAQKVGVRSTAIKSIHRTSCSDGSARDPLATPFLCLERTAGQLTWVGQIPILHADTGAAPAFVSLLTATSALQPNLNQVDPQETRRSEPPGCLSHAGFPVTGKGVHLTNARLIKACVEPTRSSDRYRLLAALEFGHQSTEARLEVEWVIASHLESLTAWNTEDDSLPSTLGQTLGLTRLWSLVTDLFALEPKSTPLIELGLPDGGGD